MALRLYRFRFPAGVHLARGSADLTSVDPLPRSDTWTAALVSIWASAFPGDDVGRVASDPPFRISSSLPWVDRDGRVDWFLPAPPGLLERGARSSAERKRAKRVQWIAPSHLARILGGRSGVPAEHETWQGGTVWAETEGRRDRGRALFTTETRTRLAVDRLSGGPMEGLLFATARTRFADDAGVAVLVDPGDAVTERRLDILLDLLGHVGIGGDRSCGVGHFCIEEKTIAAVPDLGRGGRLLLSLAAPERSAVEGGLLNAPAVYTLIERGGWVTRPGASSLRRRSVRMIGEGSLVCDVGGAFGRAVRVLDAMPELRLPHPIWRGGREVALAAGLPA